MKAVYLSVLISMAATSVLKSQSPEVKDTIKCASISVADFKKLKEDNPDAVVIDVRSHPEFRTGRIPGAINVPAGKRFAARVKAFNKHKTFILYCTTGVRSCRAAVILEKMGYDKVYSLKGGIIGWKKEGLPVKKRSKY